MQQNAINPQNVLNFIAFRALSGFDWKLSQHELFVTGKCLFAYASFIGWIALKCGPKGKNTSHGILFRNWPLSVVTANTTLETGGGVLLLLYKPVTFIRLIVAPVGVNQGSQLLAADLLCKGKRKFGHFVFYFYRIQSTSPHQTIVFLALPTLLLSSLIDNYMIISSCR